MSLQSPPEVVSVLSTFDLRTDSFEITDVANAVEKATNNLSGPTQEALQACWAESSALGFETHETPDGGPWKTYFQPLMTATRVDGTIACQPDLGRADADVLAYWATRARTAKHPVLVARYADLVWDTTEFVTKGKRGRDAFECVKLAIDSYIAASRLDDGSALGETIDNLGRALQLALSIGDDTRIGEAVKANIDYVERTGDDDRIGTYCYLFDNLLPPKKGPAITTEQEDGIIRMFEAKFALMTTPGGQWDVDPYSPEAIGCRLATYYQRKGDQEARTRIVRAIAEAFERRARLGDSLSGLFFFEKAREYFVEAGLREDADRVQGEAQKIGPDAETQMAPISVKQKISTEELDEYLDDFLHGGVENALLRFVGDFLPVQSKVAESQENLSKTSIAKMVLGEPVVLGHGHIKADVGDESGDPDGKMVHATCWHMQFDTPWIEWVLDRMICDGLTANRLVDFICSSPLFAEDRLPLIRRGVGAHFLGDYTQAIHLLIPQIERALIVLVLLAGKPSNKTHRTGRGVMQFKNLNDVLARDEWPILCTVGEDLRMYLLAALAHPKGMNIRNDVCHGLWSADRFTKAASERALHVLLTVSKIRLTKDGEPADAVAQTGPPSLE